MGVNTIRLFIVVKNEKTFSALVISYIHAIA